MSRCITVLISWCLSIHPKVQWHFYCWSFYHLTPSLPLVCSCPCHPSICFTNVILSHCSSVFAETSPPPPPPPIPVSWLHWQVICCCCSGQMLLGQSLSTKDVLTHVFWCNEELSLHHSLYECVSACLLKSTGIFIFSKYKNAKHRTQIERYLLLTNVIFNTANSEYNPEINVCKLNYLLTTFTAPTPNFPEEGLKDTQCIATLQCKRCTCHLIQKEGQVQRSGCFCLVSATYAPIFPSSLLIWIILRSAGIIFKRDK